MLLPPESSDYFAGGAWPPARLLARRIERSEVDAPAGRIERSEIARANTPLPPKRGQAPATPPDSGYFQK